jgi:SPP1 gp7 family putative phage head morphogenesis protein
VKSKKVRRVSEVNTKRINKRKYYGVGVEIDEMKEALQQHFTHTSVIDNLQSSLAGVEKMSEVSEAFPEDVATQTNFLREDTDAAVEDLEQPLSNSYEKGTRRAFNSQGDSLSPPDNVDEQINEILQEQKNYIRKLDNDLQEKARQIIRDGVRQGLAKSVIVENLRSELKNMIENRSSTIANTEVVAAAGAGVMATFQANDVQKVVWVSSQDEKVCKPGNFRTTYNGTTYTSCRELDGETFEIPGNFPEPVLESHPNCRCTLVADQ